MGTQISQRQRHYSARPVVAVVGGRVLTSGGRGTAVAHRVAALSDRVASGSLNV